MIVKIDNLDHNGKGIARINDKITFVSNALPNEIVDIRVIKEKKNYNIAETISVIGPSPERVEPTCPYFNICGGCDLMHMNYNYQIEYKKENIKNIIKKYAYLEINPEIEASDKNINYRNKITLHKINNKLGFMKKNSNEIIEINYCPLAMNSINDYIKTLPKEIKDELIIRTNEKGEIISNIIDKPLIIKINEFKFYVDIKSFFQVNNYICGKVFEFISDNLENVNTCLDLYSGVGTLSLLASKTCTQVYGIEINEYSHKNAIKNLELNNIKNVKFLLGSVEEKISEIKEKIDLIITDPPRSGIDLNTLNIIRKMNPKKIIYMSCDPMTLARDLNILKETYDINKFKIFDMFPNTKHIESVCVLNRR